VADSKKITDETPKAAEDIAEDSDDAVDAVEEPEAEVVIEAEETPTAPRKPPLGVKEVPAFKWKLVGTASYSTLTLFKAVEREDAEAQLERVLRDGYYQDLKIVDIDAKVQQPKQPASVRKQQAADAKKEATAAKKAAHKKAMKKAPRTSGTIKVSMKNATRKFTTKKAGTKKTTPKKPAAKKASVQNKAVTKKKSPKKAAPAKKTAGKKTTDSAKKAAPKKTTPKKTARKKKK